MASSSDDITERTPLLSADPEPEPEATVGPTETQCSAEGGARPDDPVRLSFASVMYYITSLSGIFASVASIRSMMIASHRPVPYYYWNAWYIWRISAANIFVSIATVVLAVANLLRIWESKKTLPPSLCGVIHVGLALAMVNLDAASSVYWFSYCQSYQFQERYSDCVEWLRRFEIVLNTCAFSLFITSIAHVIMGLVCFRWSFLWLIKQFSGGTSSTDPTNRLRLTVPWLSPGQTSFHFIVKPPKQTDVPEGQGASAEPAE